MQISVTQYPHLLATLQLSVDLTHPTLTSVCLHAQQSLWIERTTLILSRPLPGISRWSEVERREVVRSSGSRYHLTLDFWTPGA